MPLRNRLRRLLLAFVCVLLAVGLVTTTTAVPSGADVDDGWAVIDVGLEHTCGVTTVGEAYCWGSAHEGALGNGSAGELGFESIPALVPAPAGVIWARISAGEYFTCALTAGGGLYCWGSDNLDEGSLGNGPVVGGQYRYPDPTPVDTPPGVVWASISSGRHSCALTTAGAAYCWGNGDNGQIGNGANADAESPALVSAPPGVVWQSIEVGSPDSNNFGSRTTCAISTTGVGYCWGADSYGQLGDGDDLVDHNVPVPVLTPAGASWTSIRPGMNHTCGVTDAGAGYCWGRPESGRLGRGYREGTVGTPTEVVTPAGVTWTTIDTGAFYSCGLPTDGDLFCWGG